MIRLRPRCDGTQQLLSFELKVDPEPLGAAESVDQDGNSGTQLWFHQPAEVLRIESRFVAETLRHNPYDFLLPAEASLALPMEYGEPLRAMLEPYVKVSARPDIEKFAEESLRAAGNRAMPFLTGMNQRIFEEFRYAERLEGAPRTAEETLATGEGSCRDLAVLFCDLCRCAGFATRFVSGYEQSAASTASPHMHAWAEVYLPGGGWRGFDPSRGTAVSAGHVAVAAARLPELAAPVTGSYRGAASAAMEAEIAMVVEPYAWT